MTTFRTRSLPMFVAAVLALNASPAFAGIAIDFTTPTANSNYAVGSPIGYGGWILLTAPERIANRLTVDLVYFAGSNPPPGSGVILDQSIAVLSAYEFMPPPPWAWTTATATWANPDPNDLYASQYQGNTTGYHLRAIPYWKTSIPYQFVGGGTYFVALALGQITR